MICTIDNCFATASQQLGETERTHASLLTLSPTPMQEPTASPTATAAAPDLAERERQETLNDRRVQTTGDTNTKLANNLNVRVSPALYNDLANFCSGKVTDEGEFLTPSKLIRRLIIREIYSQPTTQPNTIEPKN